MAVAQMPARRLWFPWKQVGALAAVIVACAFLGWWCVFRESFRITTEEVQADISANLPQGSSADAVTSFLDARGWSHGSIHRAGIDSYLAERNVPSDAHVMIALISDAGRSFMVKWSIRIYFVFDGVGRDERVSRTFVTYFGTGP